MTSKKRIFVSSVQKELADERWALKEYVHGEPLLRRFFEVFLFEDLPASDRRADAVYLHEVERSAIYVGLFGNDYGYENVFAKQIEMLPFDGPLFIGISSSGTSKNIVKAFEMIEKRKTLVSHSVALVGFDGGTVLKEEMADVILHVNSHNYGIVEDCHSIILHALIQKLRINTARDVSKICL